MTSAADRSVAADAASAVDRRAHLSHRDFIVEYLRPLRPVIVTDALEPWPARERWTFDFFRLRYGMRQVTIDGCEYRFADLIDSVERSTGARPAPYFRNVLVATWAPELLADINPLPSYTRPNWLDSRLLPDRQSLVAIELYIGGAGAAFPVLHYDNLHTHAFLMQVRGVKDYVFYPPDASALLYPRGGRETNKSAIDDLERPDLQRFPLFARAVARRCRLSAGELLFVPAGWWHTARIVEPSITVSANTANAANWRAFTRDYIDAMARHRPWWRAQAAGAYLAALGVLESLVSTC